MVYTHSIRKLLLFIYYFRKRRERRKRKKRRERGEKEEKEREEGKRKKEPRESFLHQKQFPPQLTLSLLHTHLEKKKRERRD